MTDTAILEYILGDVDPLLRPKPNKVPVYCTLFLFIMFFGIVCFGLFLLLRDKRFEDLGKAIFF